MAALTDFREAVQTHLQGELGVEFFGGIISGPVEDRDVGCCWVANMAPSEDDALVAAVDLRVRVLLRTPQPQEGYAERDPERLETLAETVAASLRSIRSSVPGVWFFRILNFELDLEENGVEATVQAFRDNPAALA